MSVYEDRAPLVLGPEGRLAAPQEQQKLYPNLHDEHELNPQTYRLTKISEIEKFFLDEIAEREKLAKKFKRVNSYILTADTSLVIASIITGSISIPALFGVVSAPIGAALAGISLALALPLAITRRSVKKFNLKQKKHEELQLLGETKLDSVSDLISKALKDGQISDVEYEKILKEVSRYRSLKEDIRSKTKKAVDNITEQQREALLAQGRQEGKNELIKKVFDTGGTTPSAPTAT